MLTTIKGKKYSVVTITEFAKMCDRRPSTLRKMESQGVLLPANIRTKSVIIGDKERPGYRLYTLDLATKVSAIIREEVLRGVELSGDVKSRIREEFLKEKQLLGI